MCETLKQKVIDNNLSEEQSDLDLHKKLPIILANDYLENIGEMNANFKYT